MTDSDNTADVSTNVDGSDKVSRDGTKAKADLDVNNTANADDPDVKVDGCLDSSTKASTTEPDSGLSFPAVGGIASALAVGALGLQHRRKNADISS